jgi:hypothetical protein
VPSKTSLAAKRRRHTLVPCDGLTESSVERLHTTAWSVERPHALDPAAASKKSASRYRAASRRTSAAPARSPSAVRTSTSIERTHTSPARSPEVERRRSSATPCARAIAGLSPTETET